MNSFSGLSKGGFNVVHKMSMLEIDPEFHRQHRDTLDSPRGAGYWLWKPYFINKLVSTLREDHILFYSDSGSIFLRRLDPIFDTLMSEPKGVLCFSLAGKHIEKSYTKAAVFNHLEAFDPLIYDTPQRMASFICFRGTSWARDFAAYFLRVCCIGGLIDDSKTELANDGSFIDHRHDQSIWSILTKQNGVKCLPDPTQWGLHHRETTINDFFIYHSRDPN